MKKIKLFLAVSLLVSMLTVSSCNVSEPSNNNSQSTENSSSQQSNISKSSQSPEELGWKESEKHNGIMYNNTAKASDLITVTYPEDKINEIIEYIEGWQTLNYEQLSTIFQIECLRKTDQGYYAVLMQDDGKRAFFFIDDELQLKDFCTIVIDQFKTKEEFDSFLSIETNNFRNKVWEFDSNTFGSFFNLNISAHIVKEGVIFITYTDHLDGQIINDSIVESVEFFSNEDSHGQSKVDSVTLLPHILEIDKINP